jgi:hypothetical protein
MHDDSLSISPALHDLYVMIICTRLLPKVLTLVLNMFRIVKLINLVIMNIEYLGIIKSRVHRVK